MRHSGQMADYFALVERLKAAGSYEIHHDLCSCQMEHAIAFARAEARRSVQALYLPLHTEAYARDRFFPEQVRHLRRLGHAIGLHHDAIGVWLAKLTPPVATLERALAPLRESGEVTVAAAHGASSCYTADGRARYFNYEVWDACDPAQNVTAADAWKFERASLAELGLEERYFGKQTVYVSDSGGSWRGWRGNPRPRPFERVGGAMVEGLGVLDGISGEDHVVALVHPCWWFVGASE